MKLHISDFQMININEHTIVISEKGVTKIQSRPLIHALHKLRTLTSTSHTKKYVLNLLEKFELNAGEAFTFLEKILNIHYPSADPYFKHIIIAHEWDREFEDTLASELHSTLKIYPINRHLLENVSLPESLIIIAPKKYNHQKTKHIYFEIAKRQPTSCICIAMRTGDYFYVSQPYLPTLGSPCHFCNFDNIIHAERVRPTTNNWSSLLNFCTDSHVTLPEQQFTRLQSALATGLLLEKIKLWTRPGYGHRSQDRIMLASFINLFNGHVTEEHITHWQMCDCLRPQK